MTALVICAVLLEGQATAPQGSAVTAPAPSIVVAPFETPTRDGRTYWLGEAAAILITDDLNARGIGAVTRLTRERAYEQLHLPANTALSRATLIKVGELVGAAQVIVGDVQVDGEALTIRARSIRIDVGRADADIVERGDLRDLFGLAQKASGRLVAGGREPTAAATPSLQAFEQYVKGLLAEQPASRASFLEAALRLDPGYDRARLALWEVRTAQGDDAAALSAARAVGAGSPDARRARFLAGVSLMALKQYDEAFTIFKTLQDAAPDPAILNNLGILQLRRVPSAETGKATFYLTKAADADPDDPDALFNLGYAYALDRDPQAAIYWLREALRRNPADGDAHGVLAAELEASGSVVEAERERELAAQLSARYADPVARRALPALTGGPGRVDSHPPATAPSAPGHPDVREPLPRGLERVRQDLDSHRAGADAVDLTISTTAQHDQHDLARFHLDRGRRLFEAEEDRDAMAELRRAVFLSPYEAEAHLLIGRIHLRASRPREAVDALKISIWSQDTAAAQVALADAYLRLKDVAAARIHVQRALALDPASADAKALLQKLDRGEPVGPTFRSGELKQAGCWLEDARPERPGQWVAL